MRKYRLLYLALIAWIFPTALSADNYVIINQVLYDTPLNEDPDDPPYSNGEFVELYNAGTTAVNLQGWKLTTQPTLGGYTFPNISIPSEGYVIVACRMGANNTFQLPDLYPTSMSNIVGPVLYQNNFALANQEETVSLVNAQNDTVDRIYYDGNANLSNPYLLHAKNVYTTPGDSCVSLHRTWVEFDSNGKVIPEASQWITDFVSSGASKLPYASYYEEYITGSETLPDGENYMLSITPLDPTTRIDINDGRPSVSSGVRIRTNLQYMDGLGRKEELIQMGVTPGKNDLVAIVDYNGLSNPYRQWLPIVMTTEGQRMDIDAVQYQAKTDYGDTVPYSKTLHENSSLGRITGRMRPGASWIGHPTSNTYDTNNGADGICIFDIVQDSILRNTGSTYAATLYKNTTADEDGVAVIYYTDILDRKIMEERDGNYTYYVYDDLGRLRYVLPHINPSRLTYGEYQPNNSTLRAAAYYYQYDAHGNMIYKRLPGCEPQYMVYDRAGKLVLKQDGNQRASDKWLMFAYDSIGRNIYTAEIETSLSHNDLISSCANEWMAERYDNNDANAIASVGYTFSLTGVTLSRMLSVNYYDNYDFLNLLDMQLQSDLSFAQETGYGKPFDNATGLMTGTRIYNITEAGSTITAHYYDAKGRVVQSRGTRNAGGYVVTSNDYLFDGSVAQQLIVQGPDSDQVREHYRYTYDHAGRAKNVYYQLNNDAEIILSAFSYDSVGRLVQNLLHNSIDTISYSYDIRNMLTRTYSRHFTERLYYADSLSNLSPFGTPYYNGNISASSVTLSGSTNSFIYTYDNQNRLTESKQLMKSPRMSEKFEYSANGNITRLKRYRDIRLIDDLSYTYHTDGNQLLSITDNGLNSNLSNVIEYEDYSNEQTTMYYDANGNLICDMDRKISVIRYNILNLPDTIQFTDGNQIVNLYDAAGHKYKSIVYTVPESTITQQYTIAPYTLLTDTVDHDITDYSGNIETHFSSSDSTMWRRIHNTIGYHTNNTYYHYLKDHLGNICAVVNSPVDTVVQKTRYYASGVPMSSSTGREEQPYLYNGKEFIEAHGLNEYDSEARRYYATIMRTTTIDPMAESYYHISPYAWCGNNPITKIDEDGQYYYDWEDECYRSHYGNHEIVDWSTIVENNFKEPMPNMVDPMVVVEAFFLGIGPKEWNFSQNDKFTQQFINDNERLEEIYVIVQTAIFIEGFNCSTEDKKSEDGKYNYSLKSKGLSQLLILPHDLVNFSAALLNKAMPFGLTVSTGNVAASVIGSFEMTWAVERYDSDGNAVVKFNAKNQMSAGSATRLPIIGYSKTWNKYVTEPTNKVFDSKYNIIGIMRTVTINITWTQNIKNPNKK